MENKIFTDLYFGNYQITDIVSKDEDYMSQLKKLCKLEDYISKNKSKHTNNLFEDYKRINDKLQKIEIITAYEQGFRLAQNLLTK